MTRPTLDDVARRAGVSRSTASNILTGFRKGRYNAETQQRVHEAAAALSYRPNAAARALVRRSTGILAMLAWRTYARSWWGATPPECRQRRLRAAST